MVKPNMKKLILLAILSLFAFAASAQEKNKQIPFIQKYEVETIWPDEETVKSQG